MAGDKVLANGVIDSDGNVIYTFTDYVNTKDDVKATLTMPAYIDPENVKKTGNVTLATGIGSTTANKTVLVDYEKYGKFYNLYLKVQLTKSIKQIIRIVRQFMSIQVEITFLRRF